MLNLVGPSDYEYVTLDEIKSEYFGSFEELLKKYDNVILKKKF